MCVVCLSYGEKSGKEAGLTLNFAVRDVKDFLKIRKLVKKNNQFVDFGVKSSSFHHVSVQGGHMIHLENKFGIQISTVFIDFIEQEVLPETSISADQFWFGLAKVVKELTPINKKLLERRTYFQRQINEWHRAHKGKEFNFADYKNFLYSIGYIVPEKEPFAIDTKQVDPEISKIAGPQLVVPIMNARFALNAANARWGSLYDALYGTDARKPVEKTIGYNKNRG